MSSWLIPANTKLYDVFSAFAQGVTYWPMSAKIVAGDTLYIYLAAPQKQIGFVCGVLGTGYDLENIKDQIAPFIKGALADSSGAKPFMKLATRQSFAIDPDGLLSLDRLRENGLSGMLMGARKLENNPPLLAYIEGVAG